MRSMLGHAHGFAAGVILALLQYCLLILVVAGQCCNVDERIYCIGLQPSTGSALFDLLEQGGTNKLHVWFRPTDMRSVSSRVLQ